MRNTSFGFHSSIFFVQLSFMHSRNRFYLMGFIATKANVQSKQNGGKMGVVFSHSKFSHLLFILTKFKLASSLNLVGLYTYRANGEK